MIKNILCIWFLGTYYAFFTEPAEQVYIRLKNKKTGRFLSICGTQRASKHQAYLQLPEVPEANEVAQRSTFRFGYDEEEEPTSMQLSKQITTEDDADAPIYDLQGRRVKNATKGIYIKNGKIFFVK